jgi:hypothetical protein
MMTPHGAGTYSKRSGESTYKASPQAFNSTHLPFLTLTRQALTGLSVKGRDQPLIYSLSCF